ncbi:MAG TPA: T9SS type A sorting domain-containing protein, partial [Bacteroidia bacterium]|nr:T9SS type A sorting domain-containing protein [Bacteroidia bacterium]
GELKQITSVAVAANDTGYFRVRLQNKVGHKFPSGYPARRSVLQFVIQDAIGDTIFKSGIFDAEGRVVGETPAFEPHHDFISQSDIPQIYELVMGDVNGNFTSVLERAAIQLKDNRLPPAGFTTQHSAYDTVQISADALADPDFNKTGIVEGSGADEVHYHVPMQQVNGAVKVTARLYYQSVPPKWLDEMFQLNSAEIDSFRIMYQAADKTPVTVQQDSLNLVITGNYQVNISAGITVYPTVSTDGKFSIKAGKGTAIVQVEMFDLSGKKVLNLVPSFNGSEWVFNYQGNAGAYLVRVLTNNGIFTRKILKRN